VAIVGDSHAAMWLPAFDQLGKDERWAVHTFTKSSCPLTFADRVLDAEKTHEERDNCRAWIADVVKALRADPSIHEVYTTAFSSAYEWSAPSGDHLDDPRIDGFVRLWRELEAAGKTVRVIRDVPRTSGQDVPTCLATHGSDRTACAVPRPQALRPDAIADAARAAGDVPLLDLTDQFCDSRLCYPVIGNAVAYMDTSHLSTSYSRALAPYLEAQIEALGRR
jgi:hypothetical protein